MSKNTGDISTQLKTGNDLNVWYHYLYR